MYLKRLDVTGFKSFAGKTSIDFVPGVTGVVGPNGSGKSNITEAIRWVLGEQSARSLRGSKMEDIIFSGSDAKKAVNMAEVTLTLDNGDHYLPVDYSEISVTRRVFRSGDSEFLLNGQNCRLKDIVDLFMDSGVGKEAYSVIGQGKIDEILNSKAEEKRKIFEEASGVLKYKLRKQAAEKKLDESVDNLNRVEDILHELESRLGPLEEQASIAKDYLDKKKELREVEVAVLVRDIEETHADWTETKESVAGLKKQIEALTEQIKEKEQVHHRERETVAALDRDIESTQAGWAASGENLEKLIGRRDVLTERQSHARSSAEDLRERAESIRRHLSHEEKVLDQAKAAYRSEREKLKSLQDTLKKKTAESAHFEQNLDEMIEQMKSEYIEILNGQASMRNERRYLTEQRDILEKKKVRIQANTDEIRELLHAAQKKRIKFETELKEKADQGKKLRERVDTCRSRLKAEKEQYDKLRKALDQIDRYIGQALSKKETLEAMNEDYAGYYQGVRAVLKRRRELPGIEGAVAELIHVTEKYETAIEIALGAASQHVVVADEAAGRRAIQFLRSHQAGRATFLPLPVMKERSVAAHDLERIRDSKAFIGTADTLVRFKPEYTRIIRHLLGAIVVADNLEGANRLARQLGFRYRIVTLEGDIVSPGGSMTGGSLKQKRIGLIGRSSEIEQISSQIKEMKKERDRLRLRFSDVKGRIAADETEAGRFEEAMREAADAYRHLEERMKEAAAEERTSREKYTLLDRENDDFASEQQSIAGRLKNIDRDMEESTAKERTLKAQIDKLSQSREDREASKEALRSEITQLQVQTAEQGQITIHRKEKAAQAAARVDEMNTTLNTLLASISNLNSDLENQSVNKDTLDQEIDQAKEHKEQLARTLEEQKQRRRKVQEAIARDEQMLAEKRRTCDAVAGELQKHEVSLGRLDVRLDHLLDALRTDYELTFEAARDQYPLTIDLTDARKKVTLIKRSIEELGTVNPGAIEEYENVSERATFLSAQRDDLLKARATLENVMNEMDKEVEQRFSKTFKAIRSRFQSVFRELFGGGRADLRLIDPDDLLESGVDILAEPPGKKLQRLSLLSGGERALTAIALLFAILKVRPVPFCVLDEVEAALDDANVDRYAEFLKAFSQETQFIVVTHRHGTMEHADVLYGITMQESGVSKLVSVRLEETEELLSASR